VSSRPPSRSSGRTRPALRVAALLGAAVLLPAPPARSATVPLPPIPAPALPPPDGPPAPPPSFVHARLTVPFDSLRAPLERILPAGIRAVDRAESVSVDEVLKDEERAAARAGVLWRGPIRRGPFEAASQGDTLYLRAPVHYRIEIEGRGFAPARCGFGADSLLGLAGTATRFGWGEGWRLESRSWPLAAIYPTRCKPRPPAINFTKLVDDRIKRDLVAPLARVVDSLTVAADLGARVASLHAGLARPVPLAGSEAWLHWRPGAIRAERPRLEGGAIVLDLAVETDPILSPEAGAEPAAFPAAPAQRLSDPDAHLPVDCWVDFSEIAGRLVGLAVSTGDGGDSLRIAGAVVRGARDRLAIELELAGAVDGRAHLVGTLRCLEPGFALEIPDLDWSGESRRALESALPAAHPAASAPDHLVDHVQSRLRFDLRPCVTRWNVALTRGIAAAEAGGTRWRAGFSRRSVASIFCTERAVGVRVIEQGRVRASD
jgi:hypothetical protein